MEKNLNYKKSEILIITGGDYSDYEIKGLFKVEKDFNAKELLHQWGKELGLKTKYHCNKKPYYEMGIKQISFLGWLNKNGYISDINYEELNIGYSWETSVD